jgi:hypothetical protein
VRAHDRGGIIEEINVVEVLVGHSATGGATGQEDSTRTTVGTVKSIDIGVSGMAGQERLPFRRSGRRERPLRYSESEFQVDMFPSKSKQ